MVGPPYQPLSPPEKHAHPGLQPTMAELLASVASTAFQRHLHDYANRVLATSSGKPAVFTLPLPHEEAVTSPIMYSSVCSL